MCFKLSENKNYSLIGNTQIIIIWYIFIDCRKYNLNGRVHALVIQIYNHVQTVSDFHHIFIYNCCRSVIQWFRIFNYIHSQIITNTLTHEYSYDSPFECAHGMFVLHTVTYPHRYALKYTYIMRVSTIRIGEPWYLSRSERTCERVSRRLISNAPFNLSEYNYRKYSYVDMCANMLSVIGVQKKRRSKHTVF